MEAQTYSVFGALGSREAVDLVLELLERPGGVRDLEQRAEVPKSTASRALRELESAGVIGKRRPYAPYEIALADETRTFLEAASAYAQQILDARKVSEQKFQRRVRKSRFRTDDEAKPAAS